MSLLNGESAGLAVLCALRIHLSGSSGMFLPARIFGRSSSSRSSVIGLGLTKLTPDPLDQISGDGVESDSVDTLAGCGVELAAFASGAFAAPLTMSETD